MQYVIALDQGTTSSRAIAFDRDGRVQAAAQREFRQIFPRPGWVEHDPEEIWSSQAGVLAEVIATLEIDGSAIAAIGITNQRETDALVRKWAWPQIRYALWLLVLIKLVLPPDLHLPSSVSSKLPSMAAQVFNAQTSVPEPESLVSFSIVEASTGTSVGMNAVTPPRRAVGLMDKDPAADPPVLASPAPPPVKPSRQCYALALWCLGMLVLSTWLWGKLRGLRRGVSDASGNESLPASLERLVPQCAEELGLSRVPEVRLTRSILCPAVTGIFRPVLLMPVDFLSKLSPKSTEHMLLHEFAHIKRGDLYVHGVYMILQIIYWYNPLVWLVSRQMHHLREICCDATVAQHLKDRAMEYRHPNALTRTRIGPGRHVRQPTDWATVQWLHPQVPCGPERQPLAIRRKPGSEDTARHGRSSRLWYCPLGRRHAIADLHPDLGPERDRLAPIPRKRHLPQPTEIADEQGPVLI